MRILLIEDDTLIGDGLKTGLSKMGFSIDWFTEGRQGKEALYSAPYDAVILDLTLPGIDGRDILREWRANGKQEPVLILTARDALAERVEGLRLGADDYLCKPFALIEVAARLEALVRRASGQASNTLRHGQVTLDPGALVDHAERNMMMRMMIGGKLQKALDLSAATSTRREIGKAGGWGFGGEDSSPIEAAGLAMLGITVSKRNPKRKARVS